MQGFIYIITNTINGKQYVGQTIQSINKRFDRHCQYYGSEAENRMAIKLAIHKYGRKNFTIKVLEQCDVELLNERETYYIEKFDTYNSGYNSTRGGQIGNKPLKLEDVQEEIISLYKEGFSLRAVATEFNVDKWTIKHILELNNIKLRSTRTYKFSEVERQKILEDTKLMSRKEVMTKWNVSKSYLSQLINGKRRI